MSLELTTTAQLLSQQTKIGQQIILEIDGIDLIFGAVEVTKFAQYGDAIKYGQQDLVYGGVIEDPRSRDWISLKGTTNQIKNQIEPDKSNASSIQRISINLIDKDEKLTALFQPQTTLDDLLGTKANIYIAFQGGSHPEDSIKIMSGVIDSYDFGAGNCLIGISNPQVLKRTTLFPKVIDTLPGAIDNSQTTITLNSTAGYLLPETILKTYVQIDDEIIEYTGISGNDLTGCVRGVKNTVANPHDPDAEVNSRYGLTGNPIDLALNLMLSGENEFYDTENVSSFVTIGTDTLADTFLITDSNFEAATGIVPGDLVTITGSDGGLNDVVDGAVSSIEVNGSGTLIRVDGAGFVAEIESSATASFKSKYRVLTQPGTGCDMTPGQVDVEQHEFIFDLFNSAFPDYDFLLDDEINAKDFIDQQIMYPAGLYTIPRKGKASVNITIPPLADATTKVLDETNVKNPDKLKIKRSINKYFYNSVIYKYEKDSIEEKFLRNNVTVSQKSFDRIKTGNKPLVIESDGIRDGGATSNFIEIQTRRFLDRYQYGAESIEVECLYKAGFNIEVGDSVIFGSPALQVSDSDSGNRQFKKRIFECINKTLDIKQGRIKLSLLDTSFGLDGRFGVISPSSLTDTGSSATELIIKKSFGTEEFEIEKDKWEQYVGETIQVHNDDFTLVAETVLQGFDPTNPSKMLIDPALPFTPTSDYVIEAPEYPTSSDPDINFTWKNLHVSMNPSVLITNGISQTQFEIDNSDVFKFTTGQPVRVHDESFTNDSTPSLDIDDATVTDITGNLITVSRDLGFTPSVGFSIELIGYVDDGVPYRYI